MGTYNGTFMQLNEMQNGRNPKTDTVRKRTLSVDDVLYAGKFIKYNFPLADSYISVLTRFLDQDSVGSNDDSEDMYAP